jgi:hypothetical protein
MSSAAVDGSDVVQTLAARLRLVQADAAGLPPEKRREFLAEEIDRNLKDLPKPNRRRCLEELLGQFPVGGHVVSAAAPAPAPAAEVRAPEPETMEQLFQRFVAAFRQLPEAHKLIVANGLMEAGIVPAGQGTLPPEPLQRMRKELGLGAEQAIAADRLAELAAILVESACKADQAAMAALGGILPQSRVPRTEPLRKTLGRFLTEKQAAVKPPARSFEKIFGCIIQALLNGPKEFGRIYLQSMSAEKIWEVATVEGGMFQNNYQLAWKRYRDLAAEYATSEQIKKKVYEGMSSAIDQSLSEG